MISDWNYNILIDPTRTDPTRHSHSVVLTDREEGGVAASQNPKPPNWAQNRTPNLPMATFTLKTATNVLHRHHNNLTFFSNNTTTRTNLPISQKRRSRLVPKVSMSATTVQTFLEKSSPSTKSTAIPIMVIIFLFYVSLLNFCFFIFSSFHCALLYEHSLYKSKLQWRNFQSWCLLMIKFPS
jgi:hypothetical protein